MRGFLTVLACAALVGGCGGGKGDAASHGAEPFLSAADDRANLIITSESPQLRVEGQHDPVAGYLTRSERALRARSAADRFRFEAAPAKPGQYRLYVWWPQAMQGAGEIWVTVNDADGETRVAADQSHHGGRWNPIGVFRADGGRLSVTLGSRSGSHVVADAIRLQYAGREPVAVEIETGELPLANQATPYVGELVAVGRPPFRWSVAAGALPEGLSLDGDTGRIAGLPARPGSYEFTLAVRDALGGEGHKSIAIESTKPATSPSRRPRGVSSAEPLRMHRRSRMRAGPTSATCSRCSTRPPKGHGSRLTSTHTRSVGAGRSATAEGAEQSAAVQTGI